MVVINGSNTDAKIHFNLPDNIKQIAKLYETSENENLMKQENVNLTGLVIIPQQSISTLVITR